MFDFEVFFCDPLARLCILYNFTSPRHRSFVHPTTHAAQRLYRNLPPLHPPAVPSPHSARCSACVIIDQPHVSRAASRHRPSSLRRAALLHLSVAEDAVRNHGCARHGDAVHTTPPPPDADAAATFRRGMPLSGRVVHAHSRARMQVPSVAREPRAARPWR
jgi:hypothetical protein